MCITAGSGQAVPAAAGQEAESKLRRAAPLESADQVTITTLADNVVGLLATDTGSARFPFTGDAMPGRSPLFEDGLASPHRC